MATEDPDRQRALERLARGRERRMAPTGRPVFNLTRAEIARSTRTATRLAGQR